MEEPVDPVKTAVDAMVALYEFRLVRRTKEHAMIARRDAALRAAVASGINGREVARLAEEGLRARGIPEGAIAGIGASYGTVRMAQARGKG